MDLKLTLFLLAWGGCCSIGNGANILGLMPVTSPSHHIWNSVLMNRLADLGHNITILSVNLPKPQEKVPPNVHYIHLEEGYSIYNDSNVQVDRTKFINANSLTGILRFNKAIVVISKAVMKSQGLKTLLNYPDDFKFDLVIHDYVFSPILLGFLHKFKYPPMVGISPFPNPPVTLDYMSNHYFPAYVPYCSTKFNAEMNFWQRLENTFVFICDTAYRRFIMNPKIDAIARQFFPEDFPNVSDLSLRTKVALINSHPAINFLEPLTPNVIEVGGLQIRDPNPLPKDLEEFINKSKSGAVFVSFGTNMKSKDFGEVRIRTILNAMAELPQYNFLWKFDVNYLKEKIPKNVIVRSFFSQGDILAHPKLKVFVTHCGGLSSHEAVHYGVPMVGVPLFVDQERNLQQSLHAGIAVRLDFTTMTTQDIVEAIKKVANDPKIQANIKEKSRLYRDRPMKPLDTEIWWIEYVMRNPNTNHLTSQAMKLNILQANSLDCLGFILFVLFVVIFSIMKLVRILWRTYFKVKSKKVKKN